MTVLLLLRTPQMSISLQMPMLTVTLKPHHKFSRQSQSASGSRRSDKLRTKVKMAYELRIQKTCRRASRQRYLGKAAECPTRRMQHRRRRHQADRRRDQTHMGARAAGRPHHRQPRAPRQLQQRANEVDRRQLNDEYNHNDEAPRETQTHQSTQNTHERETLTLLKYRWSTTTMLAGRDAAAVKKNLNHGTCYSNIFENSNIPWSATVRMRRNDQR